MSKNAVITGGTKGIGREVCKQLAQKGYQILFTGRDTQSGEALATELKQQHPESHATFLRGDLGSIDSTKETIKGIQAHFSEIDLLINNAGTWATDKKLNKDGLELTFMVNHIAPLMVTQALLPNLKAKAPARVVNVNSALYSNGKLDLEATPKGEDFHGMNTYANSKLWNAFASLEMAERLPADEVSVNALHPGVIKTDIGREVKGFMGFMFSLFGPFMKKPQDGAKGPVWVGTADELEGVSGKYYNVTQEVPFNDKAQNDADRKAVWEKSLELAGIEWA